MMKKQYFQLPLDSVVLASVHPEVISTSESVQKFRPVDRECYFSTEKPMKFFQFYSPDNCKFECITNITLLKCGCVQFYMPRKHI